MTSKENKASSKEVKFTFNEFLPGYIRSPVVPSKEAVIKYQQVKCQIPARFGTLLINPSKFAHPSRPYFYDVSNLNFAVNVYTQAEVTLTDKSEIIINSSVERPLIVKHAAELNSHDLIRRKGSFKRTIRWIKILLKEGFRAVVITAIQRKNCDDVIPLVDYLVNLRVNAHFLFTVGPAENVREENVITLAQWKDLVLKLRDKFASQKIKTDIVCQLHNLGIEERIKFIEKECRLDSKNHAVITVEGNVFSLDLEELNQQLKEWETVYNTIRPHQALNYLTPQEYVNICKNKERNVYGMY